MSSIGLSLFDETSLSAAKIYSQKTPLSFAVKSEIDTRTSLGFIIFHTDDVAMTINLSFGKMLCTLMLGYEMTPI